MTFWKSAAVLAGLSVFNATSSQAGEPVTGRWTVNPSSCEGFAGAGPSPLVVSNYAVRRQGDSCRIGRMYKTGDSIYIQAFCWSEPGEKSIPGFATPAWRTVFGDLGPWHPRRIAALSVADELK